MNDKINLSPDMTLREVMQNMVHGEVFTICKHPKNEATRWRFFEMQIVCTQENGRKFQFVGTFDPDAPEPIRPPWMDREALDDAIARARRGE